MKTSVILSLCLCVGIAGAIVYFKHQKNLSAPVATAPAAEAVPTTTPESPEPVNASTKMVTTPVGPTTAPASAAIADSIPGNPEAEAAAAFRKAIDALLSPASGHQKHAMFDQFRTNGQIDLVITELKRRSTENPNDPEIPTTLGEAMLNKVRVLHESGADVNEVGILAMQADQSFNAALKLDPSNWEAQFVKYSTMFYWPPEPTRDNEIAQKLSGLIDQQETLPTQPHFAQTYVALGNQYQKMGKRDFAETTWRLGLAKFPNDPTLQQKLAGR